MLIVFDDTVAVYVKFLRRLAVLGGYEQCPFQVHMDADVVLIIDGIGFVKRQCVATSNGHGQRKANRAASDKRMDKSFKGHDQRACTEAFALCRKRQTGQHLILPSVIRLERASYGLRSIFFVQGGSCARYSG